MTGRAGVRLFVAVDPPLEVRERLASWARATADRLGVRLIAPVDQHVTLAFLGAVDPDSIQAIAALALGCARPVSALATGRPVWMPPRRPRALAVEVHDGDGSLVELQLAVSESLTTAGLYEREHRRYRPHVTVARRPARGGLRAALDPTPALEFPAESLTLYRSRLAPAGAAYEPLARVALA